MQTLPGANIHAIARSEWPWHNYAISNCRFIFFLDLTVNTVQTMMQEPTELRLKCFTD